MQERFAIIVDGASDVCEELEKKYDIEIIQSHVNLPDGSEILVSNKWDKLDRDRFYADLKKNPDAYSTAPANAAEFRAAFEKHTDKGEGVLAISISSGISGTYSFMQLAKKEVLGHNPDAKIEIIDSLRFSVGFSILAVYAAQQREAGKSLEETRDYVESMKNGVHQAGWLDDLSFVAKKGRLTHAKAFFGSLAGVKPIGDFDYNGLTTVIGKAKGAKQAYGVLMEYIEATAIDIENQDILIAQTNRMPQAEIYKKMIEERFHPRSIRIVDVFPACGVNVGPGLMAAYYHGKTISKGLTEERALIEKLLAK